MIFQSGGCHGCWCCKIFFYCGLGKILWGIGFGEICVCFTIRIGHGPNLARISNHRWSCASHISSFGLKCSDVDVFPEGGLGVQVGDRLFFLWWRNQVDLIYGFFWVVAWYVVDNVV